MLTIFNRRELCITRSLEAQVQVRDRLQQHGIDYSYKIVDHNNYSNEVATRISVSNREILYRFYVRKSDYEQALYLIKDIKR